MAITPSASKKARSRVSSWIDRSATIAFDDPHLRSRKWSAFPAYGRSKLAVMLWGLELDRRLREAGSQAAIVFFTVHREDAIVREAHAAGGVGYVVKPRLHADLLRAVREAKAGRTFTSPL